MSLCCRIWQWKRVIKLRSIQQTSEWFQLSKTFKSLDSFAHQNQGRTVHTTTYFGSVEEGSKKTPKISVQNTTKTRSANANALIDEVSNLLHPDIREHKSRNETSKDIKNYLQSINQTTKFRKNTTQQMPPGKGRQHSRKQLSIEQLSKYLHKEPPISHLPKLRKSTIEKYVYTLSHHKDRLGIFKPPEKSQPSSEDKKEEYGFKTAIDWWNEWEAEEKEITEYSLPKNQYQEMLEWTEQGTFPSLPIDNEIGMEKENDVPFHKHVFLQDLIEEDFPKRGPIRQFMEAVILGLSQNPYLSLEEKEDHVNWFGAYFKEKMDLLKALGAVGEDKMLEKNNKV